MKTIVPFVVSTVLAFAVGISAETSNDPIVKHPSSQIPCDDFRRILTWEVPSADPIAVVGHGVMLNWQGQEIAATPVFVSHTQRYYLKSLYIGATKAQRAHFHKKQQRLCRGKSVALADSIVLNAALIAWLSNVVKPVDGATLAMKNAVLADGIEASPAMRARLNTETQDR